MPKPSKEMVQTRPGRWHFFALITVLIFLIGAYWISHRRITLVDQEFRAILLDQVTAIARTVNPERAADLMFKPEDRMNPSFRRLGHQFKTYLDVVECRGIYTLGRRNGDLIFGPESYDENDPMASPPGTIYRQPTDAVIGVFTSPIGFVEGPYEDEYGSFVSAYAPVIDSGNGELLMVVGMDVESSYWKASIRAARMKTLSRDIAITVIILGGALVLRLRYRMSRRLRRFLIYGEVYYAAAVGVTLTAMVAEILHETEARSRRWVFLEVSQSHINHVVNGFQNFRDHQIGAVARFCENSVTVEESEFRGFCEKILDYRGIDNLLWVPLIRADRDDAFIQEAREAGSAGFDVWGDGTSPGTIIIDSEPYISPVLYAEPGSRAGHLKGYNLSISVQIRSVLEKVIETGLPIAIPLRTGSNTQDNNTGIRIIYPVFEKNSTHRRVRGFVVSSLTMEIFFKSILTHELGFSDNDVISAYLLEENRTPELLGLSGELKTGVPLDIDQVSMHQGVNDDLFTIYPLFVFGETYALTVHPGSHFLSEYPLRARWITYVMGSLVTSLVTVFIGFILRHRTRLEELVLNRTIQLRERQEFLSATLRSIGDGVISTDRRGIVTGINLVAENLTGWPGSEAVGQPISSVFRIVNSRTRQPATDPIAVVLDSGRSYELSNHTALISRSGSESQIADSCAPIISAGGEIEGAVLVFRDVTKDYARREELRLIHTAVDTSTDAIGMSDPQGTHFYQNETFTDMFGYTMEEVRALKPEALYVDYQIADIVFKNIKSGQSWSGDVQMAAKDGKRLDILLRANAVRNEEGKIVALMGIHTDITDRKKAREALLKSREQYMLAANGSHDGMWDWDLITNDLFLSPKWKQMIGYRDEELPNAFETFADHLHPDDKPKVLEYIKQYLNGEFDRYSIEFRFRHRNGSYRWILARGEALRDEMGIPYRMAGSHTDITERKQAEDLMRETNAKLETAIARAEDLAEQAARANAAKSEFLANVSHEIRTPMNGVIGMTRMLMDSPLSPDQKHYANLAYSSAKALLGIIDDILDFSKSEAGKMTLEIAEFDWQTMVENATELLAVKAVEKGLEIVTIVDSSIPQKLRGDGGRLRQVLLNLGSNAVKFTHSGAITIECKLDNFDEKNVTLLVSVSDTGIGISQDKLDILFNPFTQVDQTAKRRYGGTGLGLAISRQIIDAMGGSMGVTSNEGQGSEFWFRIHLSKAPVSGKDTAATAGDLSGARIMVVDGNSAVVRQVTMLLAHRNGRIIGRNSGAEALVDIKRSAETDGPYDIVLVNQILPDMSAVIFAERIREDIQTGLPALVVMTPINLSKDSDLLTANVFAAYLHKPLRKFTINRCITDLLNRTRLQGDGNGSMIQMDDDAVGSHERLNGIRILLVEDHPINLLVTRKMLDRLGCRTDTAGNGHEAIQKLKQKPYDIVLMDCQMPEMDGFEATRRIRTPATGVLDPAVPIIAMTAHARMGDREKCLASGMTGYLSKPVESEQLESIIRQFTGRDEPDDIEK